MKKTLEEYCITTSVFRRLLIATILCFLVGCTAIPVVVQDPPLTGFHFAIDAIVFDNQSDSHVNPVTVTNWGANRVEVELRQGYGVKENVYLAATGEKTPPWDLAPGYNLRFVCDHPPCAFTLDLPIPKFMSGRATERITDTIFLNLSSKSIDPLIIAVTDNSLEYSVSGDTIPSHSAITVRDTNRNTRLNLEAKDQLPFVFAVTLKTGETIELTCSGNHQTGTCTYEAYLSGTTLLTKGEMKGNTYATIYSGITRVMDICMVIAANPIGASPSEASISIRDATRSTRFALEVNDTSTVGECVALEPNMTIDMACGYDATSNCTYEIYSIP